MKESSLAMKVEKLCYDSRLFSNHVLSFQIWIDRLWYPSQRAKRVERLLQITLIVVINSWEQINIESNDFFIVIMDKLNCSSFRIQKQIVVCDVMRNLVLFHNYTIWFYCWYEYMYSLNVDIYKWIVSFVCSFSTNIYNSFETQMSY